MKTEKEGKRQGLGEYEACLAVLKAQTEILEKITAVQMFVKNAVINREWADFELLLNSLSVLSAEFETLEARRVRLFDDFFLRTGEKDAQAGFYVIAARLPGAERKEITELYRRMKMETFKIRLANETLMQYLNEARATVASFLEAAFPDRKGRIYSRRGIHIQADMRSMVLNQRL
jgi:hypothetical protein